VLEMKERAFVGWALGGKKGEQRGGKIVGCVAGIWLFKASMYKTLMLVTIWVYVTSCLSIIYAYNEALLGNMKERFEEGGREGERCQQARGSLPPKNKLKASGRNDCGIVIGS
jgi:hypothetical protein